MHEAYTALSDKGFQYVLSKLIFCKLQFLAIKTSSLASA